MDLIRKIMCLAQKPGPYFELYQKVMALDLDFDLTEYNEQLKSYDITYALTAPMHEYDEVDQIIIANIIMNVVHKFKLEYLIPETINQEYNSVLLVYQKSKLN
jgi:hypothetical protein